MDFKEQILKMIENLNDDKKLKIIYIFLKNYLR